MTLPGFTAKHSLYRTSGQYRAAPAARQDQGMVIPAFVDPFCYSDCFDTCYAKLAYTGDVQSICSEECNANCKCTPYSFTTVDGLCTTNTVCCGSDCTSTTSCVDKYQPIYDKSLFGIYVKK